MTFPIELEPLLSDLFARHRSWEEQWPAVTPWPGLALTAEALEPHLRELAKRLRENYPHFHPLYAGQMLKPPHPAALLGQLAAALINPNNHALDGGRATARMEKEAVSQLATMFGFEGDGFLGHLTSSGTVANLEALFIAREERPGLPVVCSRDAHYTHKRMCRLLGVETIEIDATPAGPVDLDALDAVLAAREVGLVVVTLGTTGLGALDPLAEVLDRRARHGFRVHADMAYGGYYRLLRERPGLSAFARTAEVDSLVVDPHKHGLQPYGCGCVLLRDGQVARHYSHASPYTYFSSPEHHPGETTLECSRAGAAAAALWLTQRVVPHDGAMRALLAACLDGAAAFADAIEGSRGFSLLLRPALDIVCYYPTAKTSTQISRASAEVFERGERTPEPVYLAKLTLDAGRFAALAPGVTIDSESVTVLRSVLMRPEQAAWAPEIVRRLEALR